MLGSVQVSGVALSATPASPVLPGTNVVLRATAAPVTKGGQVNFFDGSTLLGTVVLPTSGPTKGVAVLNVQPSAVGAHSYTARWTGTVPTSVSNAVSYTVDVAPAVITQPKAQTVTAGQSASFTSAASGTPIPTIQWQVSTDGTNWTTISGATGTTYAIPATTAADNGHQFRAVFTNAPGHVTPMRRH